MKCSFLDPNSVRLLGHAPNAATLARGCKDGEIAIRCDRTGDVYAVPREGGVTVLRGFQDAIFQVQESARALFHAVRVWNLAELKSVYESEGGQMHPDISRSEMAALIIEKIDEKDILRPKRPPKGPIEGVAPLQEEALGIEALEGGARRAPHAQGSLF